MKWRKSSKSEAVQCVEVRGDLAALRDSKNADGPELSAPALRAFVQGVKAGRFNR